MLNEREFNLLYAIKKGGITTYRDLAKRSNLSLGSVANTMKDFSDRGLINGGKITELGIACLSPYKVKNAIILAAGMSTRFVPLSYDTPKGLLEVKGEILIERQIKQLKEAGITEIFLVLGYKKELFFYLAEKYDLKIIVNPFYNVKNNIESLFLASHLIGNSYICASDNYFSTNIYEEYEYSSFFTTVHVKDNLDECYAVTKDNDIIRKIIKGSPKGGDIIIGSAYFDSEFAKSFLPILNNARSSKEYDSEFFEILIADNLKKLPPIRKKDFKDVIFEFDSLDELRKFDDKYIDNVDSKILNNIAKFFKCKIGEITNLTLIKEGLTNTTFSFEIKNKPYVYRYSDHYKDKALNRKHEKRVLEIIKNCGLEDDYLFEDSDEGWKISKYIENQGHPNYANDNHNNLVIDKLIRLREANLHVDWIFDPFEEACRLEKLIYQKNDIKMKDFPYLKSKMKEFQNINKKTQIYPNRLCHCDSYYGNWLLDKENGIHLIDWEYSGEADPCIDICFYVADGDFNKQKAREIFTRYLGENSTEENINHCFRLTALVAFYYFVWALYKEANGVVMGESLYIWYKVVKSFIK